jgi:hypothetical protein
MTSYQTTLPHSSPVRLGHIDRRAVSRATTTAVAVLIALLFLAVTIELTMGYGLDQPNQPVARPVPGLGL